MSRVKIVLIIEMIVRYMFVGRFLNGRSVILVMVCKIVLMKFKIKFVLV